jgi:hypothetical protein
MDQSVLMVPEQAPLEAWLANHYMATGQFCMGRVESYYRQIADYQHKENAVYFVEKAAPNLLARHFFSNLREVAVVRDPRDLLCSIYSFNAKRGYFDFGFLDFPDERAYIQRIYSFYKRILQRMEESPEAICLIRYEDMVLDLAITLKNLLDFLKIDDSAALIQAMITNNTSQDVSGFLEYHRTTSSVDKSIGRWKTELLDETKAIFQETGADILEQFGYECVS